MTDENIPFPALFHSAQGFGLRNIPVGPFDLGLCKAKHVDFLDAQGFQQRKDPLAKLAVGKV